MNLAIIEKVRDHLNGMDWIGIWPIYNVNFSILLVFYEFMFKIAFKNDWNACACVRTFQLANGKLKTQAHDEMSAVDTFVHNKISWDITYY